MSNLMEGSMSLINIGIIAGIVLIAMITIGLIISRLYTRASKQVSFVRTGFGGQKVIMNGGALVFPILHETIPVNMNTLRLEVRRANDQALITRDRMRVDVTAEFYVRVKPEAESIGFAAQTLGNKTMEPGNLKSLIEGKFVDSLRAVAAEMAMKELHEQRVDFVQKVQQVVSEDLLKNGLELETVSLTGLDQTSREFFNPDNAFDAEGLTLLTREIETRRKERNDIEKDTNVDIANKNLEAERQQLDIRRDDEYARLSNEREIEIRRAEQATEIATERAIKAREAEEAEIISQREIETAKILAERAVKQERIENLRILNEKDIDREKLIDIARQNKAIAIAEKSKEQSQAAAEADKARQDAVRESEQVITVQQTAVAERQKDIEIVKAKEEAEKLAVGITVAAEAEKQAAHDHAEAVKIQAEAEADKHQIEATGQANAVIALAEADEKRLAVEAAGLEAINMAKNLLSLDQVDMTTKLTLLNNLPEIIKESVKPMENIDSIKIMQVDGLTGKSEAVGEGHSSLSDQVVNSALKYRAQAPLLDSLLKEVGLDASDINGLTKEAS